MLSAPIPAACAGLGALLGWQLGVPAIGLSAGVVLLMAGVLRRDQLAEAGTDRELHAHLARARRRDEQADLLVVRLAADVAGAAERIKECLRITDSACVNQDGPEVELCAMVDRQRLDRTALEQRLAALTEAPIRIGWSRFPEDGFTLPVLLSCARDACEPVAERAAVATSVAVAPQLAQRMAGR